jgi:asparagine synthase (glutamine-hydrolysing)
MPGITAIVSKHLTGDENRQLGIMLDRMRYEPFYTVKTYQDVDLGVYAGIVALEGDFSDRMPVTRVSPGKALLFSGECFPVDPDPLQLYEEQGIGFLADLNGWFSGIAIDKSSRQIVIFNDRYASHKRVYVCETDSAWYFSSEAKALLAILPDCRELDLAALGEFFLCGCVLDNKTLFKGISLLPGGSAWTFTNGVLEKRAYFDPAKWEAQTPMEPEPFYDAFFARFSELVPRYFEGAQPVGMSLTGGMDTRMVIAARQPAPGELPCYTFGGMYRDSFDVKLAHQIAEVFEQSWQAIRVDRAFLDDFAQHAARSIMITDGLAPVNISDEVYINRAAREIAPVRLTGKFGSQLMRGLSLFRKQPLHEELFDGEFKPYLTQADDRFDTIKAQAPSNLSLILFRELPWHRHWAGSSVAEASQLTVRSPFLDNDLVELMYRSPGREIVGSDFQLRTIQAHDPRLLRIRTDKGLGGSAPPGLKALGGYGYQFFGLGDRLYNWEKMPHSLARLDSLFAWSNTYRIFIGRNLFRHYRKWFRDELSSYVKDILLDPITLQRPFWNRNVLQQYVEMHTTGQANYYIAIRKALTIELIHRILIAS